MAELREIAGHLDKALELGKFKSDSSNNGLQFEGSHKVVKAVFGVDACAELFEMAAAIGANFVFVHHGLSWGSNLKRITGMKSRRVGLLARGSVSLYAAHLPLDANPEFGHNALIAGMLGLKEPSPFAEYSGSPIGFMGELPKPLTPEKLGAALDAVLPSKGVYEVFGKRRGAVGKVGVVSGGGCWPELLDEMLEKGVECLVTGQVDHEAYHAIMESGVNVVAMGHYRSETPGVLAVKDIVESSFGIPCEFLDIPTGL